MEFKFLSFSVDHKELYKNEKQSCSKCMELSTRRHWLPLSIIHYFTLTEILGMFQILYYCMGTHNSLYIQQY